MHEQMLLANQGVDLDRGREGGGGEKERKVRSGQERERENCVCNDMALTALKI
jgi:hypothetical protein